MTTTIFGSELLSDDILVKELDKDFMPLDTPTGEVRFDGQIVEPYGHGVVLMKQEGVPLEVSQRVTYRRNRAKYITIHESRCVLMSWRDVVFAHKKTRG